MRRVRPGLPYRGDPRRGGTVPAFNDPSMRGDFAAGSQTAFSYPGARAITISRLMAEAAAGNTASGAAAASGIAGPGGVNGDLERLLGLGPEAGRGPSTGLAPGLGGAISRLPDVAFQPQSAIPVSLIQVPISCPANLTTTGGVWTTLLTYQVSALRKLIVADVWLRFSNPYFAQVVEADLFVDGFQIGATVRLQEDAEDAIGIRAAALGPATVELRAISDVPATNWDTFIEAAILGWDVFDEWPRNERLLF